MLVAVIHLVLSARPECLHYDIDVGLIFIPESESDYVYSDDVVNTYGVQSFLTLVNRLLDFQRAADQQGLTLHQYLRPLMAVDLSNSAR